MVEVEVVLGTKSDVKRCVEEVQHCATAPSHTKGRSPSGEGGSSQMLSAAEEREKANSMPATPVKKAAKRAKQKLDLPGFA